MAGKVNRLLSVVRGFATHLRGIDPATEVPSPNLLPGRSCRATPYLYSQEDVIALMAATAVLRTTHRKATYRTLIGLLAVTGMRIGEAIGLDRGDFDAIGGVLTIRNGKFGKSRELPLHPSTVAALGDYLRRSRSTPPAAEHVPPCSSRRRAPGCSTRTFRTRSSSLSVAPASRRARRRAGRGSTTFGTLCRPHRFLTLIAMAATQERAGPAVDLSRPRRPGQDVLVSLGAPRSCCNWPVIGLERQLGGARMTALSTTLQAFFTDRLIRQRQASPHTLAAYRDTLRLMLVFAAARQGTEPSRLELRRPRCRVVGAFLDTSSTSGKTACAPGMLGLPLSDRLFRYAALRHPEHAAPIERVLAIPPKRFERRLVTFLTEEELDALLCRPRRGRPGPGGATMPCFRLACPNRPAGVRTDRPSTVAMSISSSGAHVSCMGKGRKQRITPDHLRHGRRAARLAGRTRRAADGASLPDTAPARRSAATRSNIGSRSMSKSLPATVRR